MRPLRGAHPDARRIANKQGRTGGTRHEVVAGVRVSHADRVFYPDDGITKADLARYYEAVAPWMLPHVRGRPLTLVRCPETIDECAYLRHARAWGPSALERVTIREKTKLGEYLVCNDVAGLVALVQMDVLEVHTWSSTTHDLEHPDRIVIDLDPGEGVRWSVLADAALLIRARLDALGLASFVKTTGGNGLHVVVPLVPSADWTQCLDFARALATSCARTAPSLLTATMGKQHRIGRIYVDYLRNNRTNTSVAAFSARARPGAPVSTPIAWRDLTRPPPSTIRTTLTRLRRLRRDPWQAYATSAAPLSPAMTRALQRL